MKKLPKVLWVLPCATQHKWQLGCYTRSGALRNCKAKRAVVECPERCDRKPRKYRLA